MVSDVSEETLDEYDLTRSIQCEINMKQRCRASSFSSSNLFPQCFIYLEASCQDSSSSSTLDRSDASRQKVNGYLDFFAIITEVSCAFNYARERILCL
jgi:hypothetical protein